MTSEAIVIGVNNYEFLQPLKYAQQDALAVKQFLENEARFDRVYYFAEDAPAVNGMSMRPTRNNLRRVMQKTFKNPFMGDGDNFWFFFSGHGMRSGERDFLMPIDGDPNDVAESGISTAQVSEWLRGCGADNVVMVLDACRNGGRRDGRGIGDETKELCRQTGVISLFSCSPNQFSYELEAHQQGAFTKVLLEGLGVRGGCATVARLDEYLKRRVPEIVRDCLGDKVSQMPYTIAEPIDRSHLILMPQHSRPEDLNALKMDALWAQVAGDLRLAYQCWLRVNRASGGADMQAIGEIAKLYPQITKPIPPEPKPIPPEPEPIPPEPEPISPEQTYSKLQELLNEKKWREADQETCDVMGTIIGRNIQVKDLRNYPQDAIKKIDQLWADASDGKFGFLAQARIWKQVNGNESEFDIQVGWKLPSANKQKKYTQLTFNLQDAETGHFPAFFKSWGGGGWSWRGYLLDRTSELLK